MGVIAQAIPWMILGPQVYELYEDAMLQVSLGTLLHDIFRPKNFQKPLNLSGRIKLM